MTVRGIVSIYETADQTKYVDILLPYLITKCLSADDHILNFPGSTVMVMILLSLLMILTFM